MKNPRAFPSDADPTQPGMTLLDYFAGQALVGILAVPNTRSATVGEIKINAHLAYDHAEVMLRERERRQT